MVKVAPTKQGFIVALERVINKEEYAFIKAVEGLEIQMREFDEQAYVDMRPNVTSIVFTRGVIIKKDNFVINQNGHKKRVSDLPDLDSFEKGFLQYHVEFKNEMEYNI
jgi:hypothetical protein